jgi:transposase
VEHPTRIFIDTSKELFQLHGVNAAEAVVVRRKLRRSQVLAFFAKLPPLVVGLEACGGAHYLKRNKNDGRDAEAGCEAMSRPTMRFVPIKSEARQAVQMLVGVRQRLVRERTRLTNEIRGYASELGLVAARGLDKIAPLLAAVVADERLPKLARALFAELGEELAGLEAQIARTERRLLAFHRQDELSRRLADIPGVGPVGAVMLATKTPEPQLFKCGRDFAAWMGLTPKDHSTAGKTRLGVITRAGDEDLRAVLVSGAMAVIQQAKASRSPPSPWLAELIGRKEPKEAAVALANKTARIAWKLMVSGQTYRAQPSDQAPLPAAA